MLYLSFKARDYSEALQWYNYSLSFFKAGQMDPNYAKLQRNRASCFLQLKQLEKVRQIEPQQQVGEIKVFQEQNSAATILHLYTLCHLCMLVRPKKQLKKQRDVTQRAFSLSSVFTRLQCRRTMWRKVL